jgi:hypothetical protein
MKTALNILLGIIILVIALSFVLVYANTHPPRYPLNVPPTDYGRPYEQVSFVTQGQAGVGGLADKVGAEGNLGHFRSEDMGEPLPRWETITIRDLATSLIGI